jgi:hypothetical protein
MDIDVNRIKYECDADIKFSKQEGTTEVSLTQIADHIQKTFLNLSKEYPKIFVETNLEADETKVFN